MLRLLNVIRGFLQKLFWKQPPVEANNVIYLGPPKPESVLLVPQNFVIAPQEPEKPKVFKALLERSKLRHEPEIIKPKQHKTKSQPVTKPIKTLLEYPMSEPEPKTRQIPKPIKTLLDYPMLQPKPQAVKPKPSKAKPQKKHTSPAPQPVHQPSRTTPSVTFMAKPHPFKKDFWVVVNSTGKITLVTPDRTSANMEAKQCNTERVEYDLKLEAIKFKPKQPFNRDRHEENHGDWRSD